MDRNIKECLKSQKEENEVNNNINECFFVLPLTHLDDTFQTALYQPGKVNNIKNTNIYFEKDSTDHKHVLYHDWRVEFFPIHG